MDVNGTPHVEHIGDRDRPFAIILRAEYEPQSIEFLTTNDQTLQLGVMRRPGGYVIAPHLHKPAPRTVSDGYEALFVARGRVEVTFYNERRERVTTRELGQGDTILLMTGGHGFRVLGRLQDDRSEAGALLSSDRERFTPEP